jgi:hypothetical protein
MLCVQWHLVKCRKNHAGSDHVVCPFNASHHVPKPEEQYHLSVCSDRKMVEVERYSWSLQQPKQHGQLQLPPAAPLPPSEEDWEAEATVRRSYDPSAKARQSNVLRKIEGATPSQRKEFRAQERERHEGLSSRPAGGGAAPAPPLEALRRPTLGPGAEGLARCSLLAAHMGRGGPPPASRPQLRRPGSFLLPPSLDTTATLGDSSLDTTADTLDQTIGAVGRLSLGRGRRVEGAGPAPLRRPTLGPGAAAV